MRDLIPLLIILSLIGGCCVCEFKRTQINERDKQLCEERIEYSVSVPLEALVGATESETHGRIHGEYFLFMGGIGGSINSENNYTLKYAVRDQYGVQLKTEKIENDSLVRIREVTSQEARLTTIYKTYWSYGYDGGCKPIIKMKIFEVPKGTIKKEYNIDLTK